MVQRAPAGRHLKTRVPFLDLQAQHRAIRPRIDAAIRRVLDSGQFILGAEGEALEREVAAYCGVKHAVAVASGTDALELALRAVGIGPGDEVLTTAFSFIASANAIVRAGARPVFLDIDPRTYNLDLRSAGRRITRRTKAILPVHLYGHPCDLDGVRALARRHGLKVVEDCAQAIGARYRGRRVGAFGDAAALSFYPTKNLGACGDAGMVLTGDAAVAERVRLMRAHGSRVRYRHDGWGTNSRLDELQAAILRVKLRQLDRWTAARRRLAKAYRAAFVRAGAADVTLPVQEPGCEHVYHLYTIRMRRRDQAAARLARGGIGTQIAYPGTLPDQPALRGVSRGRYPNAEAASREVVSLPLYPGLSDKAVRRVVALVLQAR